MNGYGARLMCCVNFGLGELDELGVVVKQRHQKVDTGEEVMRTRNRITRTKENHAGT